MSEPPWQHASPPPAPPPWDDPVPGSSPRPRRAGRGPLVAAAATVALVLLCGAGALVAGGGSDTDGADLADAAAAKAARTPSSAPAPRPAEAPPTSPPTTSPAPDTTKPPTPPPTAPPPTTPPTTPPPPPPAPPPPAPPQGEVVVITDVIDGDTVDTSGGDRVRLIGIDTPERGDCGYGEATAALRWLVGGQQVALVAGAADDTDRYGRLLRYVEVRGVDANLAMIEAGRAVARYDSRDGYGGHAREARYVAADAATPSANACGGPATTVAPAPAPAGGGAGGADGAVDPRFGSCAEAKRNGYGPYRRGEPEYAWYRDGDGDGTTCE